MNKTESAYESPATRFWSGLLIYSRKEGCDQIHLSPTANGYAVRVHDQRGWRQLEVDGSTDFYAALIPRLKMLLGRPTADVIQSPGERCVLRFASNNAFEITVVTRRTEAGTEEVFIAFARAS